ncbi:hypothetical protein L3Q82_015621 [Scortum barcoo]|uniref:Uncharacterized protein n=1 Tax=Scortum barcoo TaxID=214431 RepID=A0ACB8VNS4_9TELE|nr:hypothetical protein L3Q82_015621 [Scortum barcoo]
MDFGLPHTHRPQFVRVQGFESDRLLCSTGAPQGGNDGDDREQYRGLIQDFADWCLRNNLQINKLVKPRSWWWISAGVDHSPPAPVSIQGMDIDTVKSYKYLGVHLNDSLDLVGQHCAMPLSRRATADCSCSGG